MYVCGITPYDATHLGHAATYLAFDLVHRDGWTPGSTCTSCRTSPTSTIRCSSVRTATGSTGGARGAGDPAVPRGHDGAAGAAAAGLHRCGRGDGRGRRAACSCSSTSGAAYRVDDAEYPDVYFDIAAAPEVRLRVRLRPGDDARTGRRARRRPRPAGQSGSALDPLLWRMKRPGEPCWQSPMGAGRPGWHIECAVIAGNRLGPTIDVQGGGRDLIFPHHECSAAHAEVLSGVSPFARHYAHAGMISLRRREDVEVPRQSGLRLHAARRRRRPDAAATGPAVRALPGGPVLVAGHAGGCGGAARAVGGGGRPARRGPRLGDRRTSGSAWPTTSIPRAASPFSTAGRPTGRSRARPSPRPSTPCWASICA